MVDVPWMMMPAVKFLERIVTGLLFALVLSAASVAPLSASDAAQLLRFGFTGNIFGSVSFKDAEVAIQYWVELLANDMGERWKGSSRIFEKPLDLLEAGSRGEYDLISLPPIEFLRHRSHLKLDPVMVSTLNGKHMARFLLLVKKGGPVPTVAALRKKSIIFQAYGCGDAHEIWLDIELAKLGLPRTREFFGKITHVKEASKVALPVFFNQADACIMLEESFKVLAEMNPQLDRQLQVLGRSDEFLGGVVLFPQTIDRKKAPSLKKTCLRMSTYPRGKQILTLFRIDSLKDFPYGALDSLQALLDEHQKRFPSNGQERGPATGATR